MTGRTAALAAHDLTKTFAALPVLDAVTLHVQDGERFVILGPSGAGKTTLLRLLAGIESADRGRVSVGGKDVTAEPAHRRRLAMVHPHGALFAHLTVRQNLAFPLANAGLTRAAATQRIDEALDRFGLSAFAARRPAEISSGERQRAAIARAMLSDPAALLLDEPLAQLDPPGRESVREILRGVRQAIIVVTHDHEEALSTADRLAILIGGRIAQSGTPQEVYDRPASVAVAKFLGPMQMNVLPSNGLQIGVRPQDVRVATGPADFEGIATASAYAGNGWFVRVQTGAGEIVVQHGAPLKSGERVHLALLKGRIRRFDPVSGVCVD